MTGVDVLGVIGQGVLGPAIASQAIDILRHWDSPLTKWLKPESADRVIKLIRSGTAVLNSAGILWVWDPTIGTLTISGLTAANVAGFLGLMWQNYKLQDVFDMLASHRRAVGEKPIAAATLVEMKKAGGTEFVAIDPSGKIEAAKEDTKP